MTSGPRHRAARPRAGGRRAQTHVVVALLIGSPVAHAQEAFGLAAGAQPGSLLDAPTTHSAFAPGPGRFVLSGLFSHATAPVHACFTPTDEAQAPRCGGNETALVGSGSDLLLSGIGGIGRRLSVGADARARLRTDLTPAPDWWRASTDLSWAVAGADAPRVEDLSAFAQAGLLRPGGDLQVALQVRGRLDRDAPVAALPDGSSGHISWFYGGGTGLSTAAIVTGRAPRQPGETWPAWQFSADLTGSLPLDGAERATLPHAPAAMARGAASVRLGSRVAWLTEGQFTLGGVAASESAELRAGLRWRPLPRWELLSLAATSPYYAVGNPSLRLVGGLRWVPPAPTAPPIPLQADELAFLVRDAQGEVLAVQLGGDLSGVASRVGPDGEQIVAAPAGRRLRVQLRAAGRATWTETLTLEGPGPWYIERVLPDGGGTGSLDLSLYDSDGETVPEARVTLGDVDLGPVCGGCDVTLDGLPTGTVPLSTRAPTFEDETRPITIAPLDPTDLRPTGIYLSRPPGSVYISVRDGRGPRPDARVEVTRATGVEVVALDAAGEQWLVLDPDRYRVRVTAEGMGAQERGLRIDADDQHLHRAEFRLLPAQADGASLDIEAIGARGQPVEGAEVRLGDQSLGRTGSDGTARFESLAGGPADVALSHPWFQAYDAPDLTLAPGQSAELTAPLSARPGEVDVGVIDEAGAPVDATVRVERDGEIFALDRTGPDGRIHASLEPGRYRLRLSAPNRSAVILDLDVEPDRVEGLVAQATLTPRSAEPAALSLTVLDRGNAPVEGATVFLDRTAVGTTTTGGRLTVEGIDAGDHGLEVRGEFYDPWQGQLRAPAGASAAATAHLKERLGLVTLRAETADGEPVDAFVRLLGPIDARPRRLGPDGEQRFRLAEGLWEILFSNEQYGIYSADVDVLRVTPRYELTWTTAAAAAPSPIAALPRRTARVELRERATDAPVSGTLRLLGPEVLAPVTVGPDGVWTGELRMGLWETLATAAELGVGGGDLRVRQGGPPPELTLSLGPPRVQVVGEQVAIGEAISFEVGSDVIEGGSRSLIEEVARTLRTRPEIKRVRIEGHTDARGEADFNQDLSERRAAAVRGALVDLGVDAGRLETAGFGYSQPLETNDTEEGRAANRRVVFQVLEVRESSVQGAEPASDAP